MEQEMVTVFSTAKWILICLGIYFIGIIVTGLYYSGRVGESDDLVLAGRGLTLPFLVSSIVATWIGAGVVMGAASEAFAFGFQGIVFDPWAPMLTLVILGLFIAYRIRKAKYTTVVDFYTSRYGKKMASFFTFFQFMSGTSWVAGQLVALGVIIHLTTGVSKDLATFIGTLVIIIVTWFGGLWALSRLDALALVLIVLGLVIMVPFALGEVGGITGFIENASNWSELPAFSLWYSNATDAAGDTYGFMWYTGILGVTYLIAAWTVVAMGDLNCTTLTLRALAAKDEKTASKGFVMSGVIYLVVGMLPVILGMCIYLINPDFPIQQYDNVLPWFAEYFLPGWAAVLFIVSLAAAIVSTTGDNVLVSSTLIGHNLYRYFKPNATNKESLKMIRIIIPIVGLVAMAIGLYFGSIYKLIVFAGAILFPTTTVSCLGGLFWKKSNGSGAIASFVGGTISWVVFYNVIYPVIEAQNWVEIEVNGAVQEVLMESWAMWDTIYVSAIPAFLVSLVSFIVVSLVTQKSDPPKPMLDADGNSMENEPMFFWSKKKEDIAS